MEEVDVKQDVFAHNSVLSSWVLQVQELPQRVYH